MYAPGGDRCIRYRETASHPRHLHTQSMIGDFLALSVIVFGYACLGVIMALEVTKTEACKVGCLGRSGEYEELC